MILIFGCSSEEKNSELNYLNLEGTVLSPISCNEEAFEIKIENSNSLEIIGAINLPEEFQQTGLKIEFDLIEYENPNLACVTLRPDKFFKTINVQLNKKNYE